MVPAGMTGSFCDQPKHVCKAASKAMWIIIRPHHMWFKYHSPGGW